MADTQELLRKQLGDYADQDWEEITRIRVIPFLEARLPDMRDASDTLLTAVPEVLQAVQRVLNLEFEPLGTLVCS
jgi:hypothetical protein